MEVFTGLSIYSRSANKENETKIRIGVSQAYPTRTADTGRPLAQNRITKQESDQSRARHPPEKEAGGDSGGMHHRIPFGRRDLPQEPERSAIG